MSFHRVGPLLATLIVVLTGCAPSGPSRSELAATDAFVTSMPEATEVATGGDDPRSTVEGPFNGFAWRMLEVDLDEKAVVDWYRAALESDGWAPADYGYIWMMDGRSTSHAWRQGDLVMGLGFPERDARWPSDPAKTLFEVTITYQPRDE